nr:hypothetical protein [Kibdelosporangium sp. MJ126-NF4]CEL12719.1 hypothetical protein [Kibdelosporangium sp. MJ126-NF4]CTQ93479.1 hypothetical protein [Kibdelosporangium sp. MJ126-NF4]
MTFQAGIVDTSLSRRLIKARALYWAAFVGVPLVLAVVGALLAYQPEALGVHVRRPSVKSYGLAVVFVVMVVGSGAIGWLVRNRPRVWVNVASGVGLVVGAHFGLVAVMALRAQGAMVMVFLVTMLCCSLVAFAARRVLLHPLTPDLAGTALHVPVWVRGNASVSLTVGHDKLTLRRTSKSAKFAVKHELGRVRAIEVGQFPEDTRVSVTLGDPGEPDPAKADFAADAGPTLRVRFPDHVMEIPVREPDAMAELLRRRVDSAKINASPAGNSVL